MTDAADDMQLVYYQGAAGLLTERRVKLHALDITGRKVVGVEPGLGGTPWPQIKSVTPRWLPWFLVGVVMGLWLVTGALHWPNWTVYALFALFFVGWMLRPTFQQGQAEKRFVQSFDVVTVRLEGSHHPDREPGAWPSVDVRAAQPAPEVPDETVNLVIHDLSPADRWKLVRGWQSYFSMTEEAREQVRTRARAKLRA